MTQYHRYAFSYLLMTYTLQIIKLQFANMVMVLNWYLLENEIKSLTGKLVSRQRMEKVFLAVYADSTGYYVVRN